MATSVNVELWIRFGEEYQHALSIPVHECQRFSLHPLTWLCFLGYTIYGKEGYISLEPDGHQVADYRPEGVAISAGNYYYISQDNDFRLLDPKVMDDRTSYTLEVNRRRPKFKEGVVNRDRRCVVTGTLQSEALHIIPHAKGDQYIENLVAYREVVVDPRLESINDMRNGILLNRMVFTACGTSQVAFLQTPNFAMNVDDVPLVMQHQVIVELLQFAVHPSVANSRLTFHNFSCSDSVVEYIIPHNSAAVQSNNNGPPAFLFDVAYGCAALKTWGVKEFVQFTCEKTKEFYYHDVDCDDDFYNIGDETPEKTGDTEAIDPFDVVAGLWAYNARKDMHRARMMKKEQTRENIQKWRRSVD